MGLSTKWILVTILHCGYRVVRTVVHYVLVLAYWSRGRTVPPVTDPILKTSATQLAKQIREGKLSSEAVVRVFIKRILEVDPLIHAIAEKRFDYALREARGVDALIASGSVTRQQMAKDKPLLGVPFTVKSLFTVKDFPCTAGSLLFKDLRGHQDAPPVKLMREAGAILLASTNMPELGMNLESTNYMYGTTCNPYDTSRTTGGSTGGEAAILGAAGSVIGIGNDMAGSIRMPCMFAGLFGHKPSIGMVPNGGNIISPEDKHLLYTGPMCRYAEDLVTTMKILAFQNKKNLNFEREVSFEGLKVFYLYSPGHIPLVDQPDKDMRDAVKQVVSHFEKLGSKTQELTMPLLRQINKIWVHDTLSQIKNVADLLTLGKAKVDEILEVVKFIFRQSVYTLGTVIVMNVKSIPLVYNPKKVEKYKKLGDELDDQFRSLLDDRSILVMPTWPFPAPYHGEMTLSFGDICYCNIFNVVGLPSTQCPIRLNDKGLPVGVQVIGRKGNDALTIACAMELEKAFGGWVAPK